jgi:uncharacterized membrane protein
MWTEEALSTCSVKNSFRLRGLGIKRLKTFVDEAFATTTLFISIGNTPNRYSALVEAMKGIPTFAMSFAAVMLFWLGHCRWSRRYEQADGITKLYSLLLIFIILVYVYPLKLMFSALGAWATGGWLPSEFKLSSPNELIGLFVLYGLGFAVLNLLMILLFQRALKHKQQLLLDELEVLMTRAEKPLWPILSVTRFLSALMALLFPGRITTYADFMYFNLPVSMNLTACYFARKERKFILRNKVDLL